MMRCIVTYYDLAKKVINESSGEYKISYQYVLNQTSNLQYELTRMKF